VTYRVGEMVPLGPCSHSRKMGKVVALERTRHEDGSEELTGLFLQLRTGQFPEKVEVKLHKIAKWEKSSFLGHDSLQSLLLASGYTVSDGPQLIPADQIVGVEPMPKGWLSGLGI